MLTFKEFLLEARGLISGGKEAGRHVEKYITPYVGSSEHTHELGKSHESLDAGTKVKIHSHHIDADGKHHVVVTAQGSNKKTTIPISKLVKPGEEKENKGFSYEKEFHAKMEKHGLTPHGATSAGFTAGSDVQVVNKKKNKVHNGEVKRDTTAALGQLTIRHTQENGWHVPDEARAKRPKYAAEIEKSGIIEHMNAHHDPIKHASTATASGREKSITFSHPNLQPGEAYLQDHHADFVHIGTHGTFKTSKNDATNHGLPRMEGSGKWTVREKQAGNKTSRTVMFQAMASSLKKSHVNLDNDDHVKAFKKSLGH